MRWFPIAEASDGCGCLAIRRAGGVSARRICHSRFTRRCSHGRPSAATRRRIARDRRPLRRSSGPTALRYPLGSSRCCSCSPTMIYVAAGLLVATLIAMASGRVDPLLALLVALILAAILGIAPADQLAAGLSNPGVITVAAMLVIAKGIVQTGVVSRATWALLASTATAQQVVRRLALPIGVASALINTTPLVALLIPAARQLEQTKRIPAREVLLPIAHVTTLAGSVTLIGTSSNLVIAGIAGERGVDMSMLSFAAVALPGALVGSRVLYPVAPRPP